MRKKEKKKYKQKIKRQKYVNEIAMDEPKTKLKLYLFKEDIQKFPFLTAAATQGRGGSLTQMDKKNILLANGILHPVHKIYAPIDHDTMTKIMHMGGMRYFSRCAKIQKQSSNFDALYCFSCASVSADAHYYDPECVDHIASRYVHSTVLM